jgi:hypothetical protein
MPELSTPPDAPTKAEDAREAQGFDQLVAKIKAHVAKGDKAKEKSEQHYIAAGQHLKTLKKEHSGNWAEWELLLKIKVKLSTSRASELMQIADGRKTEEQVRADTAKRVMKHSRSSSLANEEAVVTIDGKKVKHEDVAEALGGGIVRIETACRMKVWEKPPPLTSTSAIPPDKAAKRIAHAEAKARAIAYSDRLSIVYDLDRAVEHISSIKMEPAEFVRQTPDYQPNQIETPEDLARLERSVEWLTELVAIGRRRLLGVGVTTAETPAKSPAQAIADRQVENVLKLADFGADPVAADPRQLDLLALITPQQGDAKAEPAAQVPTDPVTGLPLFLKRERVTAEAAQ